MCNALQTTPVRIPSAHQRKQATLRTAFPESQQERTRDSRTQRDEERGWRVWRKVRAHRRDLATGHRVKGVQQGEVHVQRAAVNNAHSPAKRPPTQTRETPRTAFQPSEPEGIHDSRTQRGGKGGGWRASDRVQICSWVDTLCKCTHLASALPLLL